MKFFVSGLLNRFSCMIKSNLLIVNVFSSRKAKTGNVSKNITGFLLILTKIFIRSF